MPVACVAYGCTNRDEKAVRERGITFHKIPSDPDKKKKWLSAIRRKGWKPDTEKDYYRLCSEHFVSTDFKEGKLRQNLLPNAVPSVFKGFPKHLQPPFGECSTELFHLTFLMLKKLRTKPKMKLRKRIVTKLMSLTSKSPPLMWQSKQMKS